MWRAWSIGLLVVIVLRSVPGHGELAAASRLPPVQGDAVDGTVVALLPTDIPKSVPNRTAGQRVLDSLLQTALMRAGYVVLPPGIVEPVWRRVVDSVRGFYDPTTGRLLIDKLITVSGAVAREVGASDLVQPMVVVVPVRFRSPAPVQYDGVTEKVTSINASGTVRALSLAVFVVDSSDTPVNCGRGGIQILEKGTTWNATPHPIPEEKVFADMPRNMAAVTRALGAFLEHEPWCDP